MPIAAAIAGFGHGTPTSCGAQGHVRVCAATPVREVRVVASASWLSFFDRPHTIRWSPSPARKRLPLAHAGDSMNDASFDDVTSLRARLEDLRVEHRDLDEAIAHLAATPVEDELMLRRLKKRKLALKDRIAAIERIIEPDEFA